MVLTYRGQPAVHWGRYPYHYSGFYSQSGDCWGMIGSIIALLLTGHFTHTGIWCSFQGEGKTESIEDDQGTGDILVGFVPFHWGTARSTVCARK